MSTDKQETSPEQQRIEIQRSSPRYHELRNETERIVDKFKNQTVSGERGIQTRLDQVKAMSERRLQDKMKLWSH